ncbi:Inositol polyphosphate 5-phosphatase OCRL-1, partial [Armadillidium nasatum]
MELLSLVKEKLLPGHKLNNVFEVDLVESLIKSTRILALIESENEETESSLKAVLVYQTVRVPVRSSIDLTLDVVIPVNGILKCEVGSSTADLVLVNLSTGEMKFVFEMPFSEQTNSFVSDIYKSTEAVKSLTPEFSWLNPYIQLSQKSKQIDGIQKDAVLTFNSFTNENDSSESFTSYGATYTHKAHLGIDQENHTFVHPSPSLAARENEIKKEMEAREDKYTYFKNYTVFIGTWNVNGQYPSIGLSEWLACDEEPPDFYAVAFQELDLNTEAFLFNVTPREQEWLNAVSNGVHPKAKYLKVRFVRLVGIMLIVLAKEEHIAHIRNVAVDTVGTGIMNKMGNKGGVSVRFELHNTSIVFINAHMAAHVEEVERRNEDHDLILARTDFRLGSSEYPKRIENHDHIYFFGDMNYRINKPRESDIKTLANKGNLKVLFEYDQLTEQKRIGRIFANYNEGVITFQPTFKYDLNSDNWDSSEKMRQPAWCDRILWKGTGIKQQYYRSHPTLRISDHKSVSALFNTR